MAITKITINDVARAAGVSKGTVDRVLHNRGEVSPASREKVMGVVKELGYTPNMYASLLASKKDIRIICLIPEYKSGEVWELTARGIDRGGENVFRYGARVETVTYDQYDLDSFREACAQVLETQPSGVILAPMFRGETSKFVKELASRGIAYEYIDSKLEDDGYYAYFGMPMYQSGYLSASLLCLSGTPAGVTVVKIARDKKGLSDPTANRRMGFEDYFREHCPETKISYITIDPRDENAIHATLDDAVARNPHVLDNVVMFNSRVHLVASWLESRGMKGLNIVGFDIIEKNLDALRGGTVRFLIGQHCDTQACAAVGALVDCILGQGSVSKKDHYTQMDIITRHNCDWLGQ